MPQQRAEIDIRPPSVSLTTDSSQVGWGAVQKGPDQEETLTQGLWSETDKHNRINDLELRAVLMGLQSLMQNVTEEHVRVNSDNTATVSCINNMGSVTQTTLPLSVVSITWGR